MPLYDYACTRCGRVREVRHGFDETFEAPCESCGAPLRRVFNAAPILFKGSGFYVTDSRSSSATGKTEKSEKVDKTEKADTTAKAEKSEKPSSESAA